MTGEPGSSTKIRIVFPFATVEDDICDLDQARYRLDWKNETYIIAVDGQVINSFDELARLAASDKYRDREFLEVRLLPYVEGG